MVTRTVYALILCPILSITCARLASAQSATPVEASRSERFGDPGQWVFSTDAALTIQRRTQKHVSGAVTTVTLAPAADYFLARNFSVGGFVALNYTKTGGDHGTRFELGPRLGYNIKLGESLSVWPRLGFSYAFTGTGAGANENALALNVFAPFLFHPASHFFAGFGPFVDTDLSGDHRATVWGAKLTLGGWL